MGLKEITSIIGTKNIVYDSSLVLSSTLLKQENPFTSTTPSGIREYSASVEDASFGDNGKAKTIQELNALLSQIHKSGEIYSSSFNGGRNAGHEIIVNGIDIACHQLPVAVSQEGATAIIGKGRVVHPQDLVTEIAYVEDKLGGKLWCKKLLIDIHATISDDVHAAYEQFTNELLSIGKGSTKSGIAQGYASYYEKRARTIEDLMSYDWIEKFSQTYNFYATLMGGENELAHTNVNRLTKEGKRIVQNVGTLPEYIDALGEAREKLSSYVDDTRLVIEDIWYHSTIPFTFEGGQGAALDPYHGIYPDITASRPFVRIGVPDSTEGVVRADQIALKVAVMKTPYMSSVGSRIHPYEMDSELAEKYRIEQNEFGRSTGRKRGVYPIDVVAMKALQKVAGYSHLVITHMDAPHRDTPIEIVVNYRDKKTHNIVPYRPYQTHWDTLYGEIVQLPSWDGESVAHVKSMDDLPLEAKQFIAFMSLSVAPVAIVTNGREQGKMISLF